MSKEEARLLLSGEVTEGLDRRLCRKMLESMTKEERREFYVKRLMARKGLTFRAMARAWNKGKPRRERISAWGLNRAVNGAHWTAFIVGCLEAGLGVNLQAFLYAPGERTGEKI